MSNLRATPTELTLFDCMGSGDTLDRSCVLLPNHRAVCPTCGRTVSTYRINELARYALNSKRLGLVPHTRPMSSDDRAATRIRWMLIGEV